MEISFGEAGYGTDVDCGRAVFCKNGQRGFSTQEGGSANLILKQKLDEPVNVLLCTIIITKFYIRQAKGLKSPAASAG